MLRNEVADVSAVEVSVRLIGTHIEPVVAELPAGDPSEQARDRANLLHNDRLADERADGATQTARQLRDAEA